jgi:hypothetical protein
MQLLLKSKPILQQSGMLRKLLLGSGGPDGNLPDVAAVVGASDAVLQSLLVYSMPDDPKAAHEMWSDILSASPTQQASACMRSC